MSAGEDVGVLAFGGVGLSSEAWKMSWSWVSCWVASVLSGGSSALSSAFSKAVVKSSAAAMRRPSWLAMGSRKLCGSHLMVSQILVRPVCCVQMLKHL